MSDFRKTGASTFIRVKTGATVHAPIRARLSVQKNGTPNLLSNAPYPENLSRKKRDTPVIHMGAP